MEAVRTKVLCVFGEDAGKGYPSGQRSNGTAGRRVKVPGSREAPSQFEAWLHELRAMVGAPHVITDEPALRWAARDALGRFRAFGRLEREACPALAVVRPGEAREVAAVLAWAARRGVAVVPRGAGTGVMGGAVPLRAAVVLELGRLNRVEVHAADLAVSAGAGATLQAVDEAARAQGLMLAHDPWSRSMATVGGAIATNGMGYLYGRYGTMADQVLGLEVAMADGSLWRTPYGPAGVPGPDLARLMAGCQGTLGIITSALLRLWPLPEAEEFRAYRFESFEAGFGAVQRLLREGVVPAVLDLSDSGPGVPLPSEETGAEETREETDEEASGPAESREVSILILGFLGFSEAVRAEVARTDRVIQAAGGAPLGSKPALRYWQARHRVGEYYRQNIWERRDLAALDDDARRFEYINVALPPSRVLEFRRRAIELASSTPGVVAGETGLWGRPEIFSMVLLAAGVPAGGATSSGDPADHPMAHLVDDLLRLCQHLGGTMETIHGPGLRLRHLLADAWGPGMRVLRRVKAALDPTGILNPGKWGEP